MGRLVGMVLVLAGASCGPIVTAYDAGHAADCESRSASRVTDPEASSACYTNATGGVVCFEGASARADCEADPERPAAAECR